MLNLAFATCHQKYIQVCENLLDHDNFFIIKNDLHKTYLFHPNKLIDDYPQSLINETNERNFIEIESVFNEIKTILIYSFTSAESTELNQEIKEKLETVTFKVLNRERCTRAGRTPVVASYDNATNAVTICPLLSHAQKESLITILSHELGHTIDPCYLRSSIDIHEINHFPFKKQLIEAKQDGNGNICPWRRGRLPQESELFADMIGSLIGTRLIDKIKGSSSEDFISYVYYRLAGCHEENSLQWAYGALEHMPLNLCSN